MVRPRLPEDQKRRRIVLYLAAEVADYLERLARGEAGHLIDRLVEPIAQAGRGR